MTLNFRFAIISDLHIALEHTIWDSPNRFHLVEYSISALEQILSHLEQLDLDFLLLPGDLTQHGERDNHQWICDRLSRLPFPCYVVPGNHDIIKPSSDETVIGLAEFPQIYHKFGYENPNQLYYSCPILPNVRLIGLNSIQFNTQGKQLGRMDIDQLFWLENTLAQTQEEVILVTIHHNVIEHLPDQSQHDLGRRYMLDNASTLLKILQKAGVKLIFTGHLHIQDIAHHHGIYDITTGSLVTYPHPYRILQFQTNSQGQACLQIESYRVESVANCPNLAHYSREWMGDRSYPFMHKLLTGCPAQLSTEQADQYVKSLRYFWADIADGDRLFDFPEFPPEIRPYFEGFGALNPEGNPTFIDNHISLIL